MCAFQRLAIRTNRSNVQATVFASRYSTSATEHPTVRTDTTRTQGCVLQVSN